MSNLLKDRKIRLPDNGKWKRDIPFNPGLINTLFPTIKCTEEGIERLMIAKIGYVRQFATACIKGMGSSKRRIRAGTYAYAIQFDDFYSTYVA